MKKLLFALPLLTFSLPANTVAGPDSASAKIAPSAGLPSLRLDNVRVDPRDGKVRGTARVNFGYAAPRSARVRVDAIDSAGNVIATGCDNLSLQLLTGHPRLPGYRTRGNAFSVKLPAAALNGVRSFRATAESGPGDGCNPEENRIWSWFKPAR